MLTSDGGTLEMAFVGRGGVCSSMRVFQECVIVVSIKCSLSLIEEPKCLTRGIKDVEQLKEISSDVMLKTSERELVIRDLKSPHDKK